MTKGPPEDETAAKDTGPGGGDERPRSLESLAAHSTEEPGAATLRGYVLDAHLIMIEARFG